MAILEKVQYNSLQKQRIERIHAQNIQQEIRRQSQKRVVDHLWHPRRRHILRK